MSEKTLQDHVSIMYKRLRYARIKAVLLAAVVYLCLLILSFSFLRRSDHVTYVIILCGAAALILALAWICRICIRDLKKLDQIMLQQCDPATYLDIIKYAVSYGKNIRLRAFQVTVFMILQQRLTAAFIASRELEKGRNFLKNEWIGKRNTRLYSRAEMNLELEEAFYMSDRIRFHELFQKADPFFRKNKLFAAQELFLNDNYGEAAALLNTYQPKTMFSQVNKQFLLGKCYEKTGQCQQACECMMYAAEHGNTMPCQKDAQEWIKRYMKDNQ